MAIRMKEWGMLRAPSSSVHLPVQGVMGWGEAAQSLGSGIAKALLGSAELVQEKEQVTATGDLADFSRRLHDISDETRSQLDGQDVRDWEYSWQQVSAPLFAEAVAELPPAAREAGRELAEAYSRRASVRALRDREISRLDKARSSWQQRVDAAVQSGDAAAAESWLQSGAGVFVPQDELETRRAQVRSRACATTWRNRLAQQPFVALAELADAPVEDLPGDSQDELYLRADIRRTRRVARGTLVSRLTERVEDEEPYDVEELELACRAGVISSGQLESARRSPRPLGAAERCTWLRRIDESDSDPAQLTELRLDILTAPIPMRERKFLLRRVELSAGVTAEDRFTLSRSLWKLYEAGSFGCPGDEQALLRLAELQQAGLPVLAGEGSEAAARWIEHVRGGGERWVCFSSQRD